MIHLTSISLINSVLSISQQIFTLIDNNSPRKHGQTWRNNCARSVAERKKTMKQFQKRPIPQNKTHYNRMSQVVKDTITEARKVSWKKFLSEIGPQTPTSKVWNFLRAMKGRAPFSIISFSDHNEQPQEAAQIAETLTLHFKKNFSF